MPLSTEDKQTLWKYRAYLVSTRPNSLPKLIQSVAYDDRFAVQEMHKYYSPYLSLSLFSLYYLTYAIAES